ncbi:hypothetical protein C0J52_02398 [Blattella germanica]|nr:hypothetical protein C0J52_02398 [Blattella germanica]
MEPGSQISKGSMLKVIPGDYRHIPPSLRKRASLRLIVDGIDKTPKPLYFEIEESAKELEESEEVSITPHTAEVIGTSSSSLHLTKGTSIELSSIQQPFTESELKQAILLEGSEASEASGEVRIPPKISKLLPHKELKTSEPPPPPPGVLITLRETPTIFHLSLPTLNVDKNTEEGLEVESDNEYYEYITVGKGRHRNVKNAEIQTEYSIRKTRATMAPAVTIKDSSASSNAWDLHHSLKAP